MIAMIVFPLREERRAEHRVSVMNLTYQVVLPPQTISYIQHSRQLRAECTRVNMEFHNASNIPYPSTIKPIHSYVHPNQFAKLPLAIGLILHRMEFSNKIPCANVVCCSLGEEISAAEFATCFWDSFGNRAPHQYTIMMILVLYGTTLILFVLIINSPYRLTSIDVFS